MDCLTAEKQKLRKVLKAKRMALSADEVFSRSQQISKNLIENLLPKIYTKNSDKIFSLYLPASNEVSTGKIAKYFHQNQISYAFPKIVNVNSPLDFVLAQENQALVANELFPKILEPQDGTRVNPDFIILPLVAFDALNSRLGMGGGFFDRTIEFLKKQNPKIIVIGLAYDFQRLDDTLPIDDTDQKLDFIVTETAIFAAS